MIVPSLLLCLAGRKTFPRARRTQVHGFRSPVNFSPTEQSPSTSSGSSVFTPDLEEAPGPARRPRRGSDIEPNPTAAPTLSVMDISPPSRCELVEFILIYLIFIIYSGFYLMFVCHVQLHALQLTGGLESSWVRELLDGFFSVMMQILAGNWRSNRSSLTQRVQRRARSEPLRYF